MLLPLPSRHDGRALLEPKDIIRSPLHSQFSQWLLTLRPKPLPLLGGPPVIMRYIAGSIERQR